MKTAEIGSNFLEFFRARGHQVVPSTPLVYHDPTLLFVNAGMVPFKPYFTGDEAAPWKRAASIQKCLRTLDIEEVGKTTRHGTFFQMNGNFSFGDYFKAEAIEWAWELVTGPQEAGCFGFDPDRVWVTVLGPGRHPDYPHGDVEAAELWQKVGVPTQRIQFRGLKDNYWNMGVPGPGGPCSEIYIDRGPQYGADGGPEADEDRFLEIWNLVFQTEDLAVVRAKDDFDVAHQLPSKNIDTGMGLERVALLLQGVDNMYEIDQIYPVIQRAAELSGHNYGAHETDDVRMRVVADHVRSSLMIMADGVTPGNEARGYVLRRLLRRSIRAMRLLGVHDPVLVDLMGISKDLMAASFSEVNEHWDHIAQIAAAEEEAFAHTLASGTAIFDLAVAETKKEAVTQLSGDQAFQLHDTYGFPIDITLEMAAEAGLSVDRARFDELMAEQKQRAKDDAHAKKGAMVSTDVYREIRDQGETPFLGYDQLSAETQVVGIIADGERVDHADDGTTIELVLRETPFYAESGGQDSDAGQITTPGGQAAVLDVQHPVPGLVVHKVKLAGDLSVGETVSASVDPAWRRGACQAHSATHVLHAALRELVGPTATQAGSYNKPGYLRFDYSGQQAMSDALKAELEERCNTAIRDDLAVSATEMPLDAAKAMGAMSLFGEKYPPIVRMVEMGGPWSRELCGGTHVASSAQIGLLTITSEASVGSGARRVEALVSTDAFHQLALERTLVSQLSNLLRVPPDQLPDRVEKLLAELKEAEKRVAAARRTELATRIPEIVAAAQQVGGITYASATLPDIEANDLRATASSIRDRIGGIGVVALVGGTSDKPQLVVATTPGARSAGYRAGTLIAPGAVALGGRGGGRDDLAQGGGTDRGAAEVALTAIRAALEPAE